MRTSSIAAAESEWIETDPRSKGIRERPFAMSSASATRRTPASTREWLAVRAVARDRLQHLGHDHGAIRLVVDVVEQLAQLRLGEEEAPVLVVAAVDGHADVVEERGEHDDDLGRPRPSAGSRRRARAATPFFVSWRRSLSAMFVTIWMWTQEWSLISRRTTAFTFATCHQALIWCPPRPSRAAAGAFDCRGPARGGASRRPPPSGLSRVAYALSSACDSSITSSRVAVGRHRAEA